MEDTITISKKKYQDFLNQQDELNSLRETCEILSNEEIIGDIQLSLKEISNGETISLNEL